MKRHGSPRPSGAPSDATLRKISILLELMRNRAITIEEAARRYKTSERSVLRDLQELREIGMTAGYRISRKLENGVVRLESFDP